MNRTPNAEKKLDETSPPTNRDASLCPPRMKLDAKLDALTAAIPLNDRLPFCQSTKFAGATLLGFPSRCRSESITMRSGSAYGSGLKSIALHTLKMVVFAPIPSARVITAVAANPGFLRSRRAA